MTISLPEDLKQFVKKRSLTAHYGTPSDYIRGLIRDDFFETVLALDLATGAIKWARRLSAFDAWTVACPPTTLPPAPVGNCPALFGPRVFD